MTRARPSAQLSRRAVPNGIVQERRELRFGRDVLTVIVRLPERRLDDSWCRALGSLT